MERVHILWHHYPDDADDDNAKLLGVYSSRTRAEEKIETFYKRLPGFNRGEGEFSIDEYVVNEDHWTEGFHRVQIGSSDE